MLNPSLLCLYLLCLYYNLVLCASSSFLSYNDNNSTSDQWLCHEDEYYALLIFKQSSTLTVELDSWKNGTDCCEWEGIKCHPLSHHVIVLNLKYNSIVGTIHSNSSLFHLRQLRVIILSNDYSSSSISSNFGHFHSLKHLDLTRFSGTVPSEIGQLSRLTYLDLSNNAGLKFPKSKMIIGNLTRLRTLNLSHVILDSQSLQSITNLSSLQCIELRNSSLRGEVPTSILNLPHLRFLDLADNSLTFPSTPSLSFNRSWSSPLEFIDLSDNELRGSLPSEVNTSKLFNLTHLDLRNNSLVGEVPSWLFSLESLELIDLSYNQLSGSISLYHDVISNFPNLSYLSLSSSGLSVTLNTNVPVDSTLANSLEIVLLSNTSICGEFPKWFQQLVSESSISTLDISHNMLTGSLPNIASSTPVDFDASSNKFIGPIDSSFCNLFSLATLDLSNNNLSGNFPHCLGSPSNQLVWLHLGSNNIHGTLPTNFSMFSSLAYLNLSSNLLVGEVPSQLFSLQFLRVIDLSYNQLSGSISLYHDVISYSAGLNVLHLGSNNIHGTLPTNFSMFSVLVSLNLSSNLLEGQIPRSLAQCSLLRAIDFKGNKLVGKFPIFLHILPDIRVLDLSSNRLHGPIINVNQEHPFSTLQILDLSNNNFSGKIPIAYIKNFKAMMTINNNKHLGGPQYLESWNYGVYLSTTLTMKGVDLNYEKINVELSFIDLSNNAFEGEIPKCIGQLVAIHSLNLSHNHLIAHIPPSIGNLTQLESLDLSSNMLTGHIPQELVSLTSLGTFNVSNNQLAGRIPTGNNMDTHTADSYKGNPELCGPPLQDCGSDDTPTADNTGGGQDDELSMWEILMMGFGTGVVVGLAWGYCMLTLGSPLWFAQLPDKMAVLLLHCRDSAFGRPARITTRN